MVDHKTKRKAGSTSNGSHHTGRGTTQMTQQNSNDEETDNSRDTTNTGNQKSQSKESAKQRSHSNSKESAKRNNSSSSNNSRNNRKTDKETTNTAKLIHRKSRAKKHSKESSPMEAAAMNVLKHIQKIGWNGVEQEFTSVRSIIQRDVFTYTSFSKHPIKNRFMDVVCLDNTRYPLSTAVPPMSDYIHANKVRLEGGEREFIATQAPMESTVEDFWRLVYDCNPPLVICLQELEVLNGRKGESYFPLKQGEVSVFGCMTVTNKQVIMNEECAKSTGYTCFSLEVVPEDTPSNIIIKLIQTSEWPDSGTSVRERRIAISMLKLMEAEQKGYTVVHCSAGIGRTGTYMLFSAVVAKLRKAMPINLPGMLLELRGQRASCIQTVEQYANVYVLLIEYLLLTHEATFSAIGTQLLHDYAAFRKAREAR